MDDGQDLGPAPAPLPDAPGNTIETAVLNAVRILRPLAVADRRRVLEYPVRNLEERVRRLVRAERLSRLGELGVLQLGATASMCATLGCPERRMRRCPPLEDHCRPGSAQRPATIRM